MTGCSCCVKHIESASFLYAFPLQRVLLHFFLCRRNTISGEFIAVLRCILGMHERYVFSFAFVGERHDCHPVSPSQTTATSASRAYATPPAPPLDIAPKTPPHVGHNALGAGHAKFCCRFLTLANLRTLRNNGGLTSPPTSCKSFLTHHHTQTQ